MTRAEGRSRIPLQAFSPRAFVRDLDEQIAYHQAIVAHLTLMRADIVRVHADAVDVEQRDEYTEVRRS